MPDDFDYDAIARELYPDQEREAEQQDRDLDERVLVIDEADHRQEQRDQHQERGDSEGHGDTVAPDAPDAPTDDPSKG